MKENVAKGGAIASALAYAFCWQLPLILASFGLGSFTVSMWFAQYRWVFLVATLVLLGLAYFITYKDKRSKTGGPWSKRILHGTTVMSLGMIAYTWIFNS